MTSTTLALLGFAIVFGIGIGVFVTRRQRTTSPTPQSTPSNPPKECRRCGRVIEVDPKASAEWYEGMHWLCFHLEYEHTMDPDLPCGYGCPWWNIQQYEQRLRELGADPEEVLMTALGNDGGDARG